MAQGSLQSMTHQILKCLWDCHVNKWKNCENQLKHFVSPRHFCLCFTFSSSFLLSFSLVKDLIRWVLCSLFSSFDLIDLSLPLSLWNRTRMGKKTTKKAKAEELQTQSGIFTTLFSGEVAEAGESSGFSSLFSVNNPFRRKKPMPETNEPNIITHCMSLSIWIWWFCLLLINIIVWICIGLTPSYVDASLQICF